MSTIDTLMPNLPVVGRLMPTTVILSVGMDGELLSTRSAVLRAAGYIVESADSLKGAVDRFLGGDFDLVTLCHSIPMKDRGRLACLIRASGSRTPVLCVSKEPGQSDPFATATIEDTPLQLLGCIRDMLTRSENAWKSLFKGTNKEVYCLQAHLDAPHQFERSSASSEVILTSEGFKHDIDQQTESISCR